MTVNIQDDILRLHSMGLLDRLLQDKATKGKILWATDAYARFGDWYSPGDEIRPQRITGDCSDLIKTRARRAMEQRTERTRQHAEVFTPLWVVKKMNDFADEQWFGRKDGFYKLTDEGKIAFTNKQKHWKQYVDARRLEITCGEAPFLVTRYDVETGEALPVAERIGLLDRKLRAVSENAADLEEWQTWALRAVQATYGYELQGDNLLIARVNVLCSVEEHMLHRWKRRPEKVWLEKLCNVVCWNLWQMDGITGCVPVPPQPTEEQLCLFAAEPLYERENLFGETKKTKIGCRLFDWRGDHSLSYQALREKGAGLMKFDFIIGNPPYQDDVIGENETFAPPIYHQFIDSAYAVGNAVELIHPARFLFNAGSTPKAWNKKMLNDPHLKVLSFEADVSKWFPHTNINGGIVVSYHNSKKNFGSIEVFTSFPELNSLVQKVKQRVSGKWMSDIVISRTAYRLNDAMHTAFPEALAQLSNGHPYDMSTNIFERLPQVFHEQKPDDDEDYVQIFGREGGKRTSKWIKRKYVSGPDNLDKYKVFLSSADGAAGTVGKPIPARIIGTPSIGFPSVGNTESFISIGTFETKEIANNALKYVESKFARTLLGILKITQHITPEKWAYVPLQDFTPASDIDWSKSIPEIDRQLYAKYGLDAAEIEFIETHVKPME